MTPISDYQWPGPRSPRPHHAAQELAREQVLRKEIEDFFGRRLGANAVLLPSGRAAIHAALEFSGLGRGDIVFAPRWSSTCVWDAIGRLANPSPSLVPAPAAALAVHKWGYPHRIEGRRPALVVEDSVDSILVDAAAAFPLDGAFEILSLPKICGAISGAIVLSRRDGFDRFVATQRAERRDLGAHQSALKFARASGATGSFDSPEALEPLNRDMDLAGLEEVRDALANLDRNAEVIARRIEALRRHLGTGAVDAAPGRLPCVFPAPIERYAAAEPALYMERRFNAARNLAGERFVACRLLPLHFGVDEALFLRMLRGLRPA